MSDLSRKYDIRNPRSSNPPPCHAELALSLEGQSEASMSDRYQPEYRMGTWSKWARAQNPNLSE